MSKDTVVFEGINEQQMTNREILETIYNALQERNYNAIDQMVGSHIRRPFLHHQPQQCQTSHPQGRSRRSSGRDSHQLSGS